MTLPAFASPDDLEARMGTIDRARAQAALDDASALIRAEAGKTWVTDNAIDTDVPDIVGVVCIAVARRVLENPQGATTMSVGDASMSLANSSTDVYLTSNEKRLIRSAAGRSNGLFTISTTREDPVGLTDFGSHVDANGTVYVDVTPEGAPLPVYGQGELAP